MCKLLNMLKKNDTAYSIGRVCALISFVVWCGVTIWLAAGVKTWGNYDTCTMGMVAMLLVQLGNKAIETRMFKVNSEK